MSDKLTIQPTLRGDDMIGVTLIVNGAPLRELPFSMDGIEMEKVAQEIAGAGFSHQQYGQIEQMVYEQISREAQRVIERLKTMPEGSVAVLPAIGMWAWIEDNHPGQLLTSPASPEDGPLSEGEVLTPEDFDGNAHEIANEALDAFREWWQADEPKVIQVNPAHLRPTPFPEEQKTYPQSSPGIPIAAQIREAINAHYADGGINFADLATLLKSNRIDNGEPLPDAHHHRGFDESYDDSLIIFHYADGSALMTGSALMGLNVYGTPSAT